LTIAFKNISHSSSVALAFAAFSNLTTLTQLLNLIGLNQSFNWMEKISIYSGLGCEFDVLRFSTNFAAFAAFAAFASFDAFATFAAFFK
jgi:hypothetical protein